MRLRLLLSVILVIILINPAGAVTLISDSVSVPRIFKCQSSTISTTLSADVGNGVFINFTQTNNGYPKETYQMTNLGGGIYGFTYGNDATLNWGNKSISYYAAGDELTSTSWVFVYSDACTGTNIKGYQNVTYRTTGFGNNTRMLFSGEKNLIEFAAQPYLDYFGYSIYVLMLFAFCSVIYIKHQSVMSSLILAFLGLVTLALSSLVPPEFKVFALFLVAVSTTVIFYRLFKSV